MAESKKERVASGSLSPTEMVADALGTVENRRGRVVELIEKKEVGLLCGERRERGRLSGREEEATSFAAANAADVAVVAAIFRRFA